MDYIYIWAWHQMTGSYQYYIDMMVAKARQDNAPEDAIFYDNFSGRWSTVDDIVNPKTEEEVTAFADRLRNEKAAPEHERIP